MEVTPVSYPDGQPVDGYGPGFFRVNGQVVQGNVLVLPDHLGGWNGYEDTEVLTRLRSKMDVLLVGTGAEIAPVPVNFRRMMEADNGPGVEMMNTPAACRTYNVLLSEGRRVGLAVFAV